MHSEENNFDHQIKISESQVTPRVCQRLPLSDVTNAIIPWYEMKHVINFPTLPSNYSLRPSPGPKPNSPQDLSIPLTHTISLTLSAQDICIEPILQHFLEKLQKLITTLQSQTNCLMGRKRTLPNYFFGQNKRRTIEVENNNVTYVEDSDGQFYQGTDVNSTLLQHSGQDDMHGLPTRVPRLIVRKSLIHVKREARALASRQFLSHDDISYSIISSNVADMAGVVGNVLPPASQ